MEGEQAEHWKEEEERGPESTEVQPETGDRDKQEDCFESKLGAE